jgi:hypothetical protein
VIRKALVLLAFAAFLATGVYSFLLPALEDARVPDEADAAACGALFDAGYRDGDGVRVEPTWYLRDRRAFLGRLEDRSHYPFAWFDERIPADPEHDLRFPRLWWFHLPGLSRHTAQVVLPAGHKLVERHACGPDLELLLIEPPRRDLTFDVLRDLKSARVRRLVPGKPPLDCPWDGASHRCTRDWWQNVALMNKDVGGSYHQCVFAESTPDGTLVEVRFPQARLADHTVVWWGNGMEGARRTHGGDVEFAVRLDGTDVLRRLEWKNAYQWNRVELDTAGVGDGPHELTFTVMAAKAGWRQFCFDAMSYR